jgi:ketosteroid isomerase-like protein
VSENLDLVRSIFAAWAEGDFSSADWADPEIDFVMHGDLTAGEWEGLDEMGEAWATMLRAWERLRAIPEEIREIDDDRVLVFVRNEGRGRGSGIELQGISTKAANVFTIRDGKVTRLVLYWNREQAIADLGLTDRESSQRS